MHGIAAGSLTSVEVHLPFRGTLIRTGAVNRKSAVEELHTILLRTDESAKRACFIPKDIEFG